MQSVLPRFPTLQLNSRRTNNEEIPSINIFDSCLNVTNEKGVLRFINSWRVSICPGESLPPHLVENFKSPFQDLSLLTL